MEKEKLVNKWAKDLEDLGYNNTKDWKYLTRRVRKNLDLKVPRLAKKPDQVLTLDEIEQLIQLSNQMEAKAETRKRSLIIQTIMQTGMSTSQLMNLTYSDIVRQPNGTFSMLITTKDNEKVYGFIPNKLLDKIDLHNRSRRNQLAGFLFCGLGEKPYTDIRALQHIIRDARKALNIKSLINAYTLKNVFIHILLTQYVNITELRSTCKEIVIKNCLLDIYKYSFDISKEPKK